MIKLTVMLSALLALSACETAKGFGKDVEKTGEVIQGVAT